MNASIRRLGEEDIPAASTLIREVFAEFEAPDYTPEGIETFHRFTDPEVMATRLREGEMQAWGAFRQGNPVGILATRGTTHISLLFVAKSCHRQGIARELLARMYDTCRTGTITVNSSPYAVPVYRRLGFIPTDTEQTIDGIRFTPMERQL